MKSLLTILFALLIQCAYTQIIITEIMYNPPESGTDSLEYIELYNNSGYNLDLSGIAIEGVEMDFTDITLAADEYLVIAENADALNSLFGINAISWEEGALNNDGETLQLIGPEGNIMQSVDYSSSAPWPSEEDGTSGEGASIELCDLTLESSDPNSWSAATNESGIIINEKEIRGTPGMPNSAPCSDDISSITDVAFEKSIQIAPNPTNDFVSIDTKEEIKTIRIYNHLGQLVFKSPYQNVLDVAHLQTGLYSLQFEGEDKIGVKRLVIQQ